MSTVVLESVVQRLTMQLAKARIALRDIKFKAQHVKKPEDAIVEIVDTVMSETVPEGANLGTPCVTCGHTPRHEDVTIASLQDKLAMATTVKVNTQSAFDRDFGDVNRG